MFQLIQSSGRSLCLLLRALAHMLAHVVCLQLPEEVLCLHGACFLGFHEVGAFWGSAFWDCMRVILRYV